MLETSSKRPLGSDVYDIADQERFALLSGDFNPIHLDPLRARREFFGGIVVHGIHAVLRVLEAYFGAQRKEGVQHVQLKRLHVRLPGPIQLGQRVDFYVVEEDSGRTRLQTRYGDSIVLDASIEWERMEGSETAVNQCSCGAPAGKVIRTPKDRGLEELRGHSGALKLYLDEELATTIFPNLLALFPAEVLSELLAVTRLVGMECPGLRSILSAIDVRFSTGNQALESFEYEVTRTDDRFSMVKMAINGPSISGVIDAFCRPAPQLQPHINDVVRRTRGDDYGSHCALIVGGSRGLGEVTAKIIAAADGFPIITYHRGRGDAERIADEIRGAGFRCEVRQFDISSPNLTSLANDGIRPTHVYYFASPKIFVSKRSLFDAALFAEFEAYYVDGFFKTYQACRVQWDDELVFFYPSTVALNEMVKDLAEYAAAKAAGEYLANHLERFDKKLSVRIRRLPRIATDQTTTLTPIPAEAALEVMLGVVKEIDDLVRADSATR